MLQAQHPKKRSNSTKRLAKATKLADLQKKLFFFPFESNGDKKSTHTHMRIKAAVVRFIHSSHNIRKVKKKKQERQKER